jgi:type VI secretion system protein ImpL
LNNALSDIWKTSAAAGRAADTEGVVLKQLRFYCEQLPQNDTELQLTEDTAVVSRARRALSRFPVLLRLYTTLKNEGNSQIQPFTLSLATGGKSLDYLTSSHDVPGVFTDVGWSTFFKRAAADASKEVVSDDWVLGPTYSQISSGEGAGPDYERRILDMYFAEYATEWLEFLRGISVRPLADLTEARSALDSFSQQDSALSRLLINVAAQTMLHREPPAGGSVSSMVSGALATLGLSTRVNRSELIGAVADQFLPLHELVTSPDGTSPAMSAEYIEALGKVHAKLVSLFGAGGQWEQVKAYIGMIATNISGDEFQDAYRLTARINQMCNTRSTQPLSPFLEQPLRQAWAAILRDAGSRLDGLWRTRIAETFRRDVESRFPFNVNGEDVPLSLLSQFLAPGEGSIWIFHENELKTFLSPEEDRWIPATLIQAQVDFSPAFLNFLENANAIGRALYGSGGTEPSVRFDITPQPVPEVTESLLEIDGRQLLYRNERALPTAFTWPGAEGAPQSRISIAITGSGERPGIPTIDGEWGFFRMLRRGRLVPQSQTTFDLIWSLNSNDGRRFDLRYKLQSRSVQNPFVDNFFSRIRCPERVTDLPRSAY